MPIVPPPPSPPPGDGTGTGAFWAADDDFDSLLQDAEMDQNPHARFHQDYYTSWGRGLPGSFGSGFGSGFGGNPTSLSSLSALRPTPLSASAFRFRFRFRLRFRPSPTFGPRCDGCNGCPGCPGYHSRSRNYPSCWWPPQPYR